MQLDDDVCYCYHVSLRKLVNFARRERPACPSQMSECLGAGTGCGWCIPTLTAIAEAAARGEDLRIDMSAEQYAEARREYRRGGVKNEFSDGRAAD